MADPRGLWLDAGRALRHNRLFVAAGLVTGVVLLMAFVPQLFLWFYPGPRDPYLCVAADALARPSREHWFGLDAVGCDYYTRVIHGARASISIGLLVTGFATAIAVVFGTVAAWYGGVVDAVIGRITDVWLSIPVLLGGIVILASLRDVTVLGIDMGRRGPTQVALVLVVLGWPPMLRLMRSQVLAVKELDYVQAARALGAGNLRLMRRHVVPNAITPVVVYATISIGLVIVAEAALTFLGLGLGPASLSWGRMIDVAQRQVTSSPHLLLFPSIFLSLTVFSFVLMGDALRDAFDPKLR